MSCGESAAVLINGAAMSICGYLHLHFKNLNVKTQFLIAQAPFQMLTGRMWLIASILDSADIEHPESSITQD